MHARRPAPRRDRPAWQPLRRRRRRGRGDDARARAARPRTSPHGRVTLGGEARFVGKRGSDPAGEIATREVEQRGVEVVGPVAEGRNGRRRLARRRGRRAHDGLRPRRRARAARRRSSKGPGSAIATWLHIAGYSLFRGPIDEAAARRPGRFVRSAGASASTSRRRRDRGVRPGAAGRPSDAAVAGRRVRKRGRAAGARRGGARHVTVLKRGPGGIVVGERALAARPVDVVDSTGAGDALAAGFLVGGAELALETAARCVGQLGAMPLERLRAQLAEEVEQALAAAAPSSRSRRRSSRTGSRRARESPSALERGGRPRGRRGPGDGRRAGRRGPGRAHGGGAGAVRRAGAQGRPAHIAACVVQARSARRPSAGRSWSAGLPGSACWRPAASAASTAAGRATRTSPADLGELARTPAVVVCAGVKSLLDVPATVELLETLGIPVVGWRTDSLPLFYWAAGGPPVSAGSTRRPRRRRSRGRTGRSAAPRSCWSSGRRPSSTREPLIEEALAAAAPRACAARR